MNRAGPRRASTWAVIAACGICSLAASAFEDGKARRDEAGLGAVVLPEPRGPVEFQTERSGNHMTLYGNNPLFGPVEIQLSASHAEGAQSQPQLPVHRVLSGHRRVLLAQVETMAAATGFLLESVPGDPLAQPDDLSYSLPIESDRGWELGQGFHGGFSHTDEANRYAIDLIVDEGTPVLAARGGIVMQVESGFGNGSTDKSRDFGRANLIRILHVDGSMALYAHLKENGVLVQAGETVGVGQVIGVSGNTGYSSGPHLHFCIQVNRGMRLVSIPFRMVGPNGYLPVGPP